MKSTRPPPPMKLAKEISRQVSVSTITMYECERLIAAAIQQAVEDEREACANIATNYPDLARSSVGLAAAVMCEVSDDIATAIRARGATVNGATSAKKEDAK